MNAVFKGRLERWNDNKGFGFIRPDIKGSDVFMHISALKNTTRRPVIGDVIHYQIDVENDGKCRAVNAKIEGASTTPLSHHARKQMSNQRHWFSVVGSLLLLVIVGFNLYGNIGNHRQSELKGSIDFVSKGVSSQDLILKDAYQRQISNIQVEGEGITLKLLPDDTKGGRHQKFIVRLNSGQSLLIAHNIDLSSKISTLREGDKIAFNGEYEWNEKGGVIHWTHHDPNGHHEAGWLKHDGRMYQ